MSQKALPSYISKYPEIQPVVSPVANLLSSLPPKKNLSAYPTGHFEIEARLGKVCLDGKNNFKPGVSMSFGMELLNQMEQYETVTGEKWYAVTDWEEQHDYFYMLPPKPGDLRTTDLLVRTTAYFKPTGIETRHMYKQNQNQMEFQYVPLTANQNYEQQYDLRVCLNFEEHYDSSQIPHRVDPEFVRIKSRKSYQFVSKCLYPDYFQALTEQDQASETKSDKSDKFPNSATIQELASQIKPTWSIDITKTWSGRTREEAELSQKSEPPLWEVEVECLDPYAYLDMGFDYVRLATSLLLKARNFLGVQTGQSPMFQWQCVRTWQNRN